MHSDNGGLKLAHMVYKQRIGTRGGEQSIVKGVTNDQLFFLQVRYRRPVLV